MRRTMLTALVLALLPVTACVDAIAPNQTLEPGSARMDSGTLGTGHSSPGSGGMGSGHLTSIGATDAGSGLAPDSAGYTYGSGNRQGGAIGSGT